LGELIMWWVYTLLGLYVLICVVLVTAVLLQPGKADAAALFGGGASQTAFGPRGAQNVLGWTTWVAAGLMVLLALIFSLPTVFGPRAGSVIRGGEAPAQQQAAPSQPPASTPPSQAPAQTPPAQGSKTPASSATPSKPESKSGSKPESKAPASSSQPTQSTPQPKKSN
jgi:preprotein translocase subunit SecG